jgi:hypothetical protein
MSATTPSPSPRGCRPVVMGAHVGQSRVARGLRAACRPVPARWAGEVADLHEVRRRVLSWLDAVPPAEDLEVVTWVSGHDGSSGPGHVFAALVGEAWSLPVAELIVRRVAIPSAWASSARPSPMAQFRSFVAVPVARRRLALVDNTIGTGASLSAASAALGSAGHDVGALVAVSASRSEVA